MNKHYVNILYSVIFSDNTTKEILFKDIYDNFGKEEKEKLKKFIALTKEDIGNFFIGNNSLSIADIILNRSFVKFIKFNIKVYDSDNNLVFNSDEGEYEISEF